MSAPLSVDDLGPRTELGDGAYGVVYQLHRRIPGQGRVAYKQFKSPPPPDRIANLAALVDARAAMTARDRGLLDAATTWPVQLVTDGHSICGFLMPLLGRAYMATVALRPGVSLARPRSAQWLVVDDAKTTAAGVDAPPTGDLPTRLLLCARIAHTLGVLHRHGLTFGDLSYNNVVYALKSGRPRTVLVDCDGVRAPGAAIEQEHSPDWWPPENSDGTLPPNTQDAATDRYKLALLILRVLTAGELASVATDPARAAGILDATGQAMLAAGLGADRDARPTAKQWFTHLVDHAAALTSPPPLTDLRMDRNAVFAGGEVRLTWQTRAADRVDVHTPDGRTHTAAGHAAGVTVPVFVPGPVDITASNRHGGTTARAGHVFVLEPPAVVHVRLPEPPLPTVEAATGALARRLSAALAMARFDPPAPLPQVAVPMPDVPLVADTGWDALTGADVAQWLRTSAPTAADVLAALTPHLPGDLGATTNTGKVVTP
ncbi:hypothetical protein ACI8AA_01135 [Geodermatophilus sp. SYSU D01180]